MHITHGTADFPKIFVISLEWNLLFNKWIPYLISGKTFTRKIPAYQSISKLGK